MSLDPQIRAADPGRSVFVTANAGSGKTTTLVNRVARLLLAGAAPGDILCVTYTKAAAAEMQTRLFEQLGDWAVKDDRDLAAALARLDEGDPDALDQEALSRARRLFARALETPGGLKIQTLHAFCETVLRKFPIEAGVSPRFKVLEDAAATALSQAARDDLARAAARDPDGPVGRAYAHFAVNLNWDQFQALLAFVEAEREALARYVAAAEAGRAPSPHALAGAEPGATPEAVEADFVATLRPNDWAAAIEGFASGSTNDQKMAERMRACAPPAATLEGLGPVFLDSKGQPRGKLGTKSAPPAAVAYLEALQTHYIATLERWRAARIAEDTVKALTLARVHAALYDAAKARAGALDFSDLIVRIRGLLAEDGRAAWVLYKLDGGVRHVLIDEAQDTAPDQWAIVRALTEEFFAGETQDRTVFAVGDEKQSIYSFQGARPERLRREARDYDARVRGAGGVFEQAPLETSYRSTPQVLAFVDAVFDAPERRRALTGPEGDIATHRAARRDQAGSVDLVPLFLDEPAPERDAWDDPVDQEAEASARKRLARALAEDIRRQVETGVAVFDKASGQPRPSGYGDFLVLVRRRDATFEEVIRALKTAGVPVAGADRLKLSSHIAFDDLVALARFALYPDDDLSLAEVLRGPLCDVPDFGPPDSLYELAGREGRRGLWRELRQRADEQPAWGRARAFLADMIAARGLDPFGFFSRALNHADGAGRSNRARMLERLGREAEEAIDETLNLVLAAEARGGRDLETALALLEGAEAEVKRELEGARGEVRVMTVHGAKGLEAPVVILPDTTQTPKARGGGLIPAAPAEDGDEDAPGWLMAPLAKGDDGPASSAAKAARQAQTDAESLRLLYVALTRARDRLVIMGRASSRGPEAGSWWTAAAETFARLEGQLRLLEDGTLRYGVDPVRLDPAPAMVEAPRAAAVPVWAARPPASDTAAPLVAPSRLEGGRAPIPAPSPLAGAGGRSQGRSLGRFRRGELIHRLLERLPEAAPLDRPAMALRMLAREPGLDDEQKAEMVAAALGVLDDPRFGPVFAPGSRAEVALAGRLADGRGVAGRIDRLVVTPDRVLVVDFKTQRPAPERIEDADPAYVRQLAVYAQVLAGLYPGRRVEAALVWTDGPRLTPVPAEWLAGALRDLA